jgi:hypothetical protein
VIGSTDRLLVWLLLENGAGASGDDGSAEAEPEIGSRGTKEIGTLLESFRLS